MAVQEIPTALTTKDLKAEAKAYNSGLQIKGEPRQLLKTHNKLHPSVVISVKTEEDEQKLIKSVILIDVALLKVAKYADNTTKIKCKRFLRFGHYSILSHRTLVYFICHGAHTTTDLKCYTCSQTKKFSHAFKCANCKSM